MLNAKSGPRIRHVVPDSMPYDTLTLDKLTPVIGAEINGVDLSERDKHSALLDCRLLASVYVELVGGHQARLEFAANGGRGALLTTVAEHS